MVEELERHKWISNNMLSKMDSNVSEEEDLSCDSSDSCAISLSGRLEKNKGHSMQVLSQLEMLRKDACELDYGINAVISCEERQKSICIEDEIEFPAFNDEADTVHHLRASSVLELDEENIHDQRVASMCNSDEETMSNVERFSLPAVGNVIRYEARDTWSEANREVQALLQLNNSALPSKVKKSSKDSRIKLKPKYLLHFPSQKEDFPLVVSDVNDIDNSVTDCPHGTKSDSSTNVDLHKSMAEALEIFKGGEVEQPLNHMIPFGGLIYHDCSENSGAKFQDDLQEKSGQPLGSYEMPSRLRGRRAHFSVTRSVYPQGGINIQVDSLLNGEPSADDESASLLCPKPGFQRQTMADWFHEALGGISRNHMTSEVKIHRQSGSGLFEKLQQVMQSEKERDMDFLESSNLNAISTDGRSCIDIRILSRCLEAKLTVCCCSLVRHEEIPDLVNNFHKRKQIGGRTLMVIFSSRVCDDIALEVGNLIRIQPPWKEVFIEVKDEVVILSTYFSQLAS
ncbi:uncharacterized protein [Coffea arabica]|uniref:Uncharacterized protein isoform X3 n=1 Tax=Coffea arabica TaxID=13443 RepID=A0ABM4W9V9_COFAR|nr:uncharacterized protein LOC113719068 isoform X3 [Coffea arabica]